MIGRARWILGVGMVALAACGVSAPAAVEAQEEILVLEVAPDSVPCVGEMVGHCIQVRSPGEEAWRKFYDPIEGFEHEVGFHYTLRVARRDVPNPPADGSAYAYRLLGVISKEPA
jgi:hypothetical protein